MEKIIPSNQCAWYAVYIKSRCEKKAQTELQINEIESFLPLQQKLRQWSDRKKWVEMPLIPGYLFVHIGRKEYDCVLRTLHVVNFVRFEGTAAVIPDYQIECLKQMHKLTNLEIEMTQEKFETGQMIQVIAGPLTGFQAKLVFIKGKNKVAIEFEQLGYSALIEISGKDIKILSH
jgi:transcription antitermination factor NusG